MSDTQNTIKNMIELLEHSKTVVETYLNSEIMFQGHIRKNNIVHWDCVVQKLSKNDVNPITRINEIVNDNFHDFVQAFEEIEPHLGYVDVQEKYEYSDHFFYAIHNVILAIKRNFNFNDKDFYHYVSFDSRALVNSQNIGRFFSALTISQRNQLLFDFLSSSKKLNDKVNLLKDFDNFKETADSKIVSNFYDYASRHNHLILKGLEPLLLDLETMIGLLSEMVD